ncbi:hypothetical protein Syn7502_03271 [Synechococcus sp. PCC 7502]|uniref:hypothetical protein n=1 Tax=Synechococcus sp. PCC 7502 TaxID=1173263 RepID=UPI00029FC4DF|nr:hypothetical protein [Synechococcus sp. PCC 7502]AFY75137.1 hypothetical protein Syn7502_03271 [Synechococcus sp. PCC 7502]
MSNQQEARMLAASQLQQQKKRTSAVLHRTAEAEISFNHGQERLIALNLQKQQLHQQQTAMTRASQQHPKFVNETRLIAAKSLHSLKHRQKSLLNRLEPHKNDYKEPEFDISRCWWITGSNALTQSWNVLVGAGR